MKREIKNFLFDNAILILLAIQIFSVYFSVALSSIAFGLWVGIWIMQIMINKKLFLNNEIKSELKFINIFLLLFIIIEVLSRIFAIFPDGALVTLKSFLFFLIFYVSIIKITDRKVLYRIILAVINVASIISVYELVRYFLSLKDMPQEINIVSDRIGYFGYPISMGEIKMLLVMSVFPLLFVKEKIFTSKILLISILLPIFASMYLTQSRNVFVAVFVCMLIYGIFINKKFLVIFVVALVIFWFIIPARFQNRISSIINPEYVTNNTRLTMWNIGLKIFKDHPLLGVGDNEITQVYKMYKEPQFNGEGSHLHDNLIMILATTGIFGFIFFACFFIALFIKQIKFYREITYETDKLLIFGSILVMISFHISGVFEWNFGDWKVITIFLFLMSVPFIIYNINTNLKQNNG